MWSWVYEIGTVSVCLSQHLSTVADPVLQVCCCAGFSVAGLAEGDID